MHLGSPCRPRVLFVLAALLMLGCGEEIPVTPPRQISPSPFQYPEELWDAGVEGETTLKIHITAAGAVDSVEVAETSGHVAFDSSAVNGARTLRFEAARRGTEPIPIWVLLPVQFDLSRVARSDSAP